MIWLTSEVGGGEMLPMCCPSGLRVGIGREKDFLLCVSSALGVGWVLKTHNAWPTEDKLVVVAAPRPALAVDSGADVAVGAAVASGAAFCAAATAVDKNRTQVSFIAIFSFFFLCLNCNEIVRVAQEKEEEKKSRDSGIYTTEAGEGSVLLTDPLSRPFWTKFDLNP